MAFNYSRQIYNIKYLNDDPKFKTLCENNIISINYILNNWEEINCPIDIWRIFPDKRIDFKYNKYYVCKNFNRFKNKCMDYKNRPYICSEYPYYGKEETVELIYEKCIFNK